MLGGCMLGGGKSGGAMPEGEPPNPGTTITPWQCGQETCWPAIEGNT
jgi:hypothetical protein